MPDPCDATPSDVTFDVGSHPPDSRRDVTELLANRFAIRHQDTKRHTDYDPMFLGWIFWCYLSTIELSNRLLARQSAQTSPATP
jgi:hypothetical protein